MNRDNDKDNDRTESVGDPGDGSDRPRIRRLGHFRIDATLGSGGMGTIYRAYDESMKRPVALKVLHSSLEISQRAQSRFVREAWIAGQLDHPNIVKVYSRGEENNVSYLAMELAEGGSLYDFIKRTRESIPSDSDITGTIDREYINDILGKFIELAGALEHIHAKGFIHRDIKPHNILLSDPDKKFKLTDFGIAHADDMTRMTRAGDFIGTVKYMSPELLAAHRAGIDRRTDIYSLGVTLYEALTLTLPFKADSEEKLIGEILAGRYIEARQTNRRIPVDLETVLMKASHHDPNLRYQTAAEFAEDLQRIIDGRPIFARRQSALSKGIKYVKRNYRVVLGIGAAAAVVALAILWAYYKVEQAYRTTSEQQPIVQTSSEPKFTKIDVPGLTGYSALSPNGKRIAFVADDSCLWVARTHGTADPSVAGDPVRLTEPIVARFGRSLPVWSADGKWIAFNGRQKRDETSANYWYSMFVIQSSGSELIEVPVKHDGSSYWANFRISLSPDGQTIAFSSHTSHTSGESKTDCIYSIPVGGGEVKRLTDTLCRQPAYSPNGEMLVYVKGFHYFHNEGSEQSEIWVVPAEGGTPILVSDIPGVLFSPIWSPDSRSIMFGRWRDHADVEGDWAVDELYIVALSESYQPLGPPTVIKLPLSTDDFIGGWSSDNKIGLFLKTVAHGATFTIPAKGGIATQLTPTFAYSPKWSPDGERIYYISGTSVYSVPSQGGETPIVPITAMESAFTYIQDFDVSPDGTRLVLSGITKGDSTASLFTVSINGGELLRLTSDSMDDGMPSWSVDGDWIAYTRTDLGYKRWDLCLVPAEGGEVRQLVASSDSYKLRDDQLTWSPDGKFLAHHWSRGDSMAGVSVIPFEGGKSEIITQLEPGHSSTSLCWSPDGKELIYGPTIYEYGHLRGYISILTLDTRKSVKLRTGLSLEQVSSIDWSPDGELIAFSCNWSSEIELWIMEDFLPSVTAEEPEPLKEPIFSMISVPGLLDYCALSPDGKRLAFVADDSCLWVAPTRGTADSTVAGEAVRLTGPVIKWALGSLPVWSADGNWIAFNTDDLDSAGTYWSSMFVIPSSGGDPIELPVKHDRANWLTFYDYRLSLSPNGKTIAFFSHTSPIPGNLQEDCIYVMPVVGGKIRRIAESLCGDSAYCAHPTYSPDGKLIAFLKGDRQCGLANEAANCDIWVVSVNGGSPVQVTNLPGVEFGPVWSPDGRSMAYCHWSGYKEHGAYDIKEISIVKLNDNYQQIDSPTVIKLPLPSDDFIGGWSTDDEIGLVLETEVHTAIYTVSASGGVATMVRPSISRCPSWSPNGDSIFYMDYDKVYSVPSHGGQESVIPIAGLQDMGWEGGCDLSPDGTQLALMAEKVGDTNPHIFIVSVHGGEARQVTFGTEEDWFPRWSPDGKWIAFSRTVPGVKKICDLVIVSAEGGEAKILVPWTDSCAYCDGLVDWSPDGKFIAYPFLCQDSTTGIGTVPVNGGTPEVLVQSDPGHLIISLRWSPDGTKLAYSIASTAYGKRSAEVWILPLDSRRPSKLKILANDLDAAVRVDWSPDGQKLVFEGRRLSRNTLCLIKDFLTED